MSPAAANGEDAVSAWDSSDAMRLKYVLPRDTGLERMVCGAEFGLRGEDTKLLDAENERAGGLDEGESGGKSGCSTFEVVGVLGGWIWSSGLLDPLGTGSPPSCEVVGHWTDMGPRRPGR